MLVTVINKQNRLTWLPKVLEMKGMLAFQEIMASGAARSLAQRNDSPLNSMADGKNQNIATSTGICSNRGRQPDSGLAPARE